MKHIGYCPKCNCKVIEARVLGMFDDFTFKCPACKNLLNVVDIAFKQVDDSGEFDGQKKKEYTMGAK